VAANDVHFLNRDDHEAHDVMICIGTGHLLIDENRMRYTPEVYFKSPRKCAPSSPRFPVPAMPRWKSPSAATSSSSSIPPRRRNTRSSARRTASPREEYLMRVCQEGLVKRYGPEKAR
jgi:DNA polymerase III subunit alpha